MCNISRASKFARLSWNDRLLLIKTLLLVCAIRLSLWLIPFDRVRKMADRLAHGRRRIRHQVSLEKIVRCVEVTATFVPAATCLTQALTCQILLGRAGRRAALKIGVCKAAVGGFKAHAWLECDGKIVIGAIPTLNEYKPLPPIVSAAKAFL